MYSMDNMQYDFKKPLLGKKEWLRPLTHRYSQYSNDSLTLHNIQQKSQLMTFASGNKKKRILSNCN